jgi:hypothetical protein
MVFFHKLNKYIRLLFESKIYNEQRNLTDVLDDGLYRIDENTLKDLLVDDVNIKLNRTKTTFGHELFDHWLKNTKTADAIKIVQDDTKKIVRSDEKRELSKILDKTGEQFRGHIISDLWNGFEIKSFFIKNIFIFSLHY